jgi:hypothetical protein
MHKDTEVKFFTGKLAVWVGGPAMQISAESEVQITFTHMQPFNYYSNWSRLCK